MNRASLSLLPILLSLTALTACAAGSDAHERMLDEGDWAWESEANCIGAARVVRIADGQISWLEDGAVLRSATLEERSLDRRDASSTGAGRAEGVIWRYLERSPSGASREVIETYQARFTTGSRRLRDFVLVRRQVNGERDRDYADLRKRLVKCPDGEAADTPPG